MLARLGNGVRLLRRRFGQPEVEAPTEISARPTVDIREHKQQVLETTDLHDLMTLCQRLDISSTGCHTLEQVRERIIAHLKEACCNSSTAVYPTLDVTEKAFDDHHTRKREFLKLVEEVQKFLAARDVRPWLYKLHIPETKDVWLEKKDFDVVLSSAEKHPTIVIAGSTLSGKTTFTNLLLGEEILPTSWNSGTRVLCEIKYGKKKCAVLEFEQQLEKETVDLSNEDGRVRFKNAFNPHISQVSKVEVFLPNEFLKFVNLVDSPGLTEDDTDCTIARGLGEQFLQDMACGFIYVLDATRSAEEASKAGECLKTVLKEKVDAPSPDSALFIANKWDMMITQTTDFKDQEEFIARSVEGIQNHLPSFKGRQLLKMNSRLAGKAQGIGWITADMEKFTGAMKTMLGRGVHYMMNRSLSRPYQLMDYIEKVLKNSLHELQLPRREMQKKRDAEKKKLDALQVSRDMKKKEEDLMSQIDKLIPNLGRYLTSNEGYRHAFDLTKTKMSPLQQESFIRKDAVILARQRFCDEIWYFPDIQAIKMGANSELSASISKATQELNRFRANVATASTAFSFTHQAHDMDNLIGLAMVVSSIFEVLGLKRIAKSIYRASVWLVSSITFQQRFEAAYRDLVQLAVAENGRILKDFVVKLLITGCPPINALLKSIPQHMENLRTELETRNSLKEEDIPDFQRILERCQQIKGEMTKFQLELNVHTYLKEDLSQEEEVGVGAFGVVYRVLLPNKEYAALKEMRDDLTVDNSDKFMNELNLSKMFEHPNVVKSLGSVVTSQNPLKLGLLFEWCGGGTLADVIADTGGPPPFRCDGFIEGQRIVSELLSGLKYIHFMGIVHGDLKPENVLLTHSDPKVVKLADMGSAKPVDQVHVGSHCGAYVYMAPEVLEREPYGLSADVYSLGIVLWEIWNARRASSTSDYRTIENSGKTNFEKIKDLISGVVSGELRPGGGIFENDGEQKSQERSDKWGNITKRCWSSLAEERPSAEGVFEEISAIK